MFKSRTYRLDEDEGEDKNEDVEGVEDEEPMDAISQARGVALRTNNGMH
jgi:hypothetical protein